MDSNYTVARIIKSVEVEGRFGPQLRISFTTNETGEKMLSAFSKFPLKEGQSIGGSIVEKPGTKTDGTPITYYNFNFAKKTVTSVAAGGMSTEQFQKLYQEVYATRQEVVMIRQLLQAKGIIPTAENRATDTTVDYPASQGPTAFDEPPIESYENI